MKRLCLTAADAALETTPDACDHIGPWSLSPERQWTWDPAALPYRGRLPGAVAFTHASGDWLLALWAERLNARHGRQHPRGYWAILLRAWLTTLVDLSFDKYLRLQARVGLPRRVRVWPQGVPFQVADTRDVIIGAEGEALNLFVMSMIARSIATPAWVIEEGAAVARAPKAAAIRRKERVLEARRWAALAATAGRVHFYNVPGLGQLNAARLSAASWRRPASRLAGPPVASAPDAPAAREAAIDAFTRHGFGTAGAAEQALTMFDALTAALLPRNLGDGYEAHERAARRRAALTPRWVDTVVCGPALGGDDEAKIYFAWMRSYRGARLVVNQHGGNYGLLETYSFVEQTDYRCADRFVSWGWRTQTGCDVAAVPAPSPALTRLARRPASDGKLILVTTNVPTYNSRIDSAVFADDAGRYRGAQLDFAAALDARAAADFWLRPYGRTSAFEQALWDRRRAGTRVLRGPLGPELERSRLVVVDHPGTTMCLTLAAGIPTVLFWDRETWAMGAAAEPALDALRAAGVLHHSPAAAAAHVNAIIAAPEVWWRDAATARAVALFADQYCRRRDDWRAQWSALFGTADSEIYAS